MGSARKAVFVLVPTEAGWVGRYTLPPLLQGHPPHPDALLLLASRRRAPGVGTLMSLPEGIATPAVRGARGGAVSSVVTSGCPKRSEGGFPVGTRTNAVPSHVALTKQRED